MENINNHIEELFNSYSRSRNRILFIDYDGTLAPFKAHPQEAIPTSDIKELLATLAKDKANRVVIISGREKETLERWLGDIPLTLVAEHGGFYKDPGQSWQSFFPSTPLWKNNILPSLYALEFQYEGSFIEEKHFSIAWHYRSVANRINEEDKKQILNAIQSLPINNEFWVYDEDCTLEFRTAGIDKGEFAELYKWNKQRFDFVLAIGDGKTDEDLFEAIGKEHFTIKVGNESNSLAKYYLDKQGDVIPFLRTLVGLGKILFASRKFLT